MADEALRLAAAITAIHPVNNANMHSQWPPTAYHPRAPTEVSTATTTTQTTMATAACPSSPSRVRRTEEAEPASHSSQRTTQSHRAPPSPLPAVSPSCAYASYTQAAVPTVAAVPLPPPVVQGVPVGPPTVAAIGSLAPVMGSAWDLALMHQWVQLAAMQQSPSRAGSLSPSQSSRLARGMQDEIAFSVHPSSPLLHPSLPSRHPSSPSRLPRGLQEGIALAQLPSGAATAAFSVAAADAAAGQIEWERVLRRLREEERLGEQHSGGAPIREAPSLPAALVSPMGGTEQPAEGEMLEALSPPRPVAPRMTSCASSQPSPSASPQARAAAKKKGTAAAVASSTTPSDPPLVGAPAAGANTELAPALSATAPERLRAAMLQAARAKQMMEAHRLLEELWKHPTGRPLLEPRVLAWAAQRRTTNPRLWWGEAERLTSRAMLECALAAPDGFEEPLRNRARLLLSALLEVAQMDHPAAREMAVLQRSLVNWQHGKGAEAVGWERPSSGSASGSVVPAHIKKMAQRYNALRTTLLSAATAAAAARGSTVSGLPCVVEGSESSQVSQPHSAAGAAVALEDVEVQAAADKEAKTAHETAATEAAVEAEADHEADADELTEAAEDVETRWPGVEAQAAALMDAEAIQVL